MKLVLVQILTTKFRMAKQEGEYSVTKNSTHSGVTTKP